MGSDSVRLVATAPARKLGAWPAMVEEIQAIGATNEPAVGTV